MECSCQIEVDADGGCDFFNKKIVTARKLHQCCECHRDITPTEKYEYFSGVWEGGFNTYKTCADCASIRDAFSCTYFTNLYEDLRNHISDMDGVVSEECMLQMTIPARLKAAGMIDEYFEDREDDD